MIQLEQLKKPARTRIVFSQKLVFSEVTEIHSKIESAVCDAESLEIDLDAVTGIDLPGYQLLLSLLRTVEQQKKKLIIRPGSCRDRLEKMSAFTGLPQPFSAYEGWDG